jgi:hypothetical protein
MSPAFKDYAMSNLYGDPTTFPFKTVAAAKDVAYVCSNTMIGSPLRRFYLDFSATYFSDPYHVTGSTEEWDQVMQEHEDVRIFLLDALRVAPEQRNVLKGVGDYAEKDISQAGTPEKKKTALPYLPRR